MRKLVLWLTVLVCSTFGAFIFMGAMTPSGGPEATTTRTTTQVEVTNFPTTQAVQGAVAVSNLAFDADGNLRAIVQTSRPSFSFIKIADGTSVTPNSTIDLGPFPSGGRQRMSIFVRGTFTAPPFYDPEPCIIVRPNFGGDGLFFLNAEGAQITLCSGAGQKSSWMTGGIYGPEAQIQLIGSNNSLATIEVWLYLSD